jgi:hypothetical protein
VDRQPRAGLRTGTPLTGRQIHGLVSDDDSLWTVQEALKALTELGLVETQSIGRAGVHTINEEHASVAPLRALLDPVAAQRPHAAGNGCDVLVFASAGFDRLAASGEPVVSDILRDGVTLIGTRPRVKHGARMMATAEQRNHAKSFLEKAEESMASAEANLAAERYTPAAGDAIHADMSAKDAIVTVLTGSTGKGNDHATAAKGLRHALSKRPEAAAAEKARRELLATKGDVEYGTDVVTATKPEPLVRRARTLVEPAIEIVLLGR